MDQRIAGSQVGGFSAFSDYTAPMLAQTVDLPHPVQSEMSVEELERLREHHRASVARCRRELERLELWMLVYVMRRTQSFVDTKPDGADHGFGRRTHPMQSGAPRETMAIADLMKLREEARAVSDVSQEELRRIEALLAAKLEDLPPRRPERPAA